MVAWTNRNNLKFAVFRNDFSELLEKITDSIFVKHQKINIIKVKNENLEMDRSDGSNENTIIL